MEELMAELKENLLMEELMTRLKENLVKERKQTAAEEGIVVNVLKEGGLVQEGVVTEMKEDNSLEEVDMDDMVEGQRQVAVKKDVARGEGPVNEKKAEHVLVEEVGGIAGRSGLHMEKGRISEFKKADYTCKEPGCAKSLLQGGISSDKRDLCT